MSVQVDDELGYAQAEVDRLRAEVDRLRAALAPFTEFAKAPRFEGLPDDFCMTLGSPMARRQVTAGDFKRALIALGPKE